MMTLIIALLSIVISGIVIVLTFVFEWMIFQKMGYPGAVGIIPLYNFYKGGQKLWGPQDTRVMKNIICPSIAYFVIAIIKDILSIILSSSNIIVSFLSLLCTLLPLYITVYTFFYYKKLCESFGYTRHSIAFTLLVMLVPIIGLGIIALGNHQFIGDANYNYNNSYNNYNNGYNNQQNFQNNYNNGYNNQQNYPNGYNNGYGNQQNYQNNYTNGNSNQQNYQNNYNNFNDFNNN